MNPIFNSWLEGMVEQAEEDAMGIIGRFSPEEQAIQVRYVSGKTHLIDRQMRAARAEMTRRILYSEGYWATYKMKKLATQIVFTFDITRMTPEERQRELESE